MDKPKPLKHDLSSLWNHCINKASRLIYFLKNDILERA
ncbi:hypothetical protein D3Z58_19385 [Clostridiaceae bacterium]|nr:type II toxin-antitoxin system YoeB family toxin [Lachnospiraceae bacterium]NBH18506.1 hypothetical protein [Clostridiaceae bacterium]NBH35644.1 hypothetical protein [Clostridiaceae bacterium]